ncbi:Gldg family protein [Lacipirellula parvula]|uniref:Gliding motility-associated ABC transporter permease protein n=1 Tax=Lacipirellula parvula TaxID=2650471 RepID=A0A5K7XFG7_9BACT|nr:Gldg family protein [Lacipirellula parvula]BBO35550.1 gliding motility-associated ABC transporter permease protein [Lacipirellula parvula]
MKWNVLTAIFKRDFVSYFSSPTGYVFICVFVVLSALATFWPPEFFASNLANLDQLSHWLPFIMLVFIPAITMSAWAEERRQGTDELLLTLPASDFDVVLGKYLAGVAIFTVSLLFSAVSIYTVFQYGLGDPDVGLYISTYIGYWFMGIAMIAIGMVASFLTANLTVGFILGMLFNMPLALFGVANWFVKDPAWAELIRRWSAVYQFGDFKRGVLSLGGMAYFVAIAAVMVYVSMILIGRRHWQSRDDGKYMLAHYLTRALALLAIAVGVTVVIQDRNALRADVSSAKLSTLSPNTLNLLSELRENKEVKSIKVDAYVSPHVPTDYAAVKLNLISTLEEIKSLSAGKIEVAVHEIPNYGPEAELAEKNFGIVPQEQTISTGGEYKNEEFFMGIAVTSGLDKVVTPFVNKGIPIEYELIRSIMTVSEKQRPKLGVINTGVPIMNPDGSLRGDWPLITELRKQYEVVSVDAAQPIRGTYDVLLAVQPSMLSPDAFDHFVDAIRAGIPTAVLEDPFPYFYPANMPGTGEEKQSQMMGMFGGGQAEPKGDIDQLWRLLGIRVNPMEVIWQNYEPEASVRSMQDPQFVFIDAGNGNKQAFNQNLDVSSGLNQLLLLYPGAITRVDDSKLKFEQIIASGVGNSGTAPARLLQRVEQGQPNGENVPRQQTKDGYILAAHITGPPPEDDSALNAPAKEGVDLADAPENAEASVKAKKANQRDMNVIVVTDIDWIIPSFFTIRDIGEENFLPATQNVPFILNIIDELAGIDRFMDIRKRARDHRTLAKIDEATAESRKQAADDQDAFLKEITKQEEEARATMMKAIEEVESSSASDRDKAVLLEQVRMREQQRLDAKVRALASQRRREIKQIDYDLDNKVRAVQDRYKLYAILIPPIPPLLLALAVFFRRRELERQGVSRERLK